MKITIAGGGNIGTQFAVHFAEKGHEVIMFTSNPGIFSGSFEYSALGVPPIRDRIPSIAQSVPLTN